jgi:hypothetical protein
MNYKQSLLISISEPIGLLQQGFSEYVIMLLQRGSHRSTRLGNGLDYNYYPFMTQLLSDLFDDHTVIYSNDRYTNDSVPASTKILIADGMEEECAIQLALVVFQSLVDIIVTFIPNIDFSSHGYRFGICGECDLHVSPSYMDNYGED